MSNTKCTVVFGLLISYFLINQHVLVNHIIDKLNDTFSISLDWLNSSDILCIIIKSSNIILYINIYVLTFILFIGLAFWQQYHLMLSDGVLEGGNTLLEHTDRCLATYVQLDGGS